MGSDCAAGGATPSEVVWVLAPVISIICAMAFFGARRFGLIGGRPAGRARRAASGRLAPLKVIALNVWLITALSVSAFVDVGCGELRRVHRRAARGRLQGGQSRVGVVLGV